MGDVDSTPWALPPCLVCELSLACLESFCCCEMGKVVQQEPSAERARVSHASFTFRMNVRGRSSQDLLSAVYQL